MKTHFPIIRQRGVTMIEVLVTMVILLVGLLGLAGLMLTSQRAEMESYQRVQAMILLQDMVDRISANRKAALCYAISGTTGTNYYGTGTPIASPACAATNIPPTTTTNLTDEQRALAVADINAWNSLLQGAAATDGGSNVGAMIGARGCVQVNTATTPYTYLVSVAWQGMSSTAAPAAAWNCASGLYGDEKKRRIVGVTLQFAHLGSS